MTGFKIPGLDNFIETTKKSKAVEMKKSPINVFSDDEDDDLPMF